MDEWIVEFLRLRISMEKPADSCQLASIPENVLALDPGLK